MPASGLDRHFRIFFDGQFVAVDAPDGVPPLPDEVRAQVQARLLEPGYLERVLPPDRFVLRGITFLKAIEVTDQEVLSQLKRDLIDRESIVSQTRFGELQQRLRTLFRRPELRLGLAALDGERVLILNYGARHEHACIFADSVHHRMDEFAGTLYERAVIVRPARDRRRPDRPRCAAPPIEDQMIDCGLRAFVVRAAALPGPGHRHARAGLAAAGRPRRRPAAEAARGAAALRHGRAAQHGGAERPHPDRDQGAVHRHPSRRRVAVPQGRARRAGAVR